VTAIHLFVLRIQTKRACSRRTQTLACNFVRMDLALGQGLACNEFVACSTGLLPCGNLAVMTMLQREKLLPLILSKFMPPYREVKREMSDERNNARPSSRRVGSDRHSVCPDHTPASDRIADIALLVLSSLLV